MSLVTSVKTQVAATSTPDAATRTAVANAAATAALLVEQLRTIDFVCFESMPATAAVLNMTSSTLPRLTRLVHDAASLLRRLPPLVGGRDDGPLLDESRVAASDSQGPAIEGTPALSSDTFCEDLDTSLAAGGTGTRAADVVALSDACRSMVRQLQMAQSLLRQAQRQRSKWALIAAGEEARRKTQKSLRASLIMATRIAAPAAAATLFANDTSELQTSLTTRQALTALRRDLTSYVSRAPSLSDVEVGLQMREVRIRLLQMCGDRAYVSVRAQDRYKMQDLHQRISQWLDRMWDNFEEARAILLEVGVYAQLLHNINNRRSLIDHDRELGSQVGAELAQMRRDGFAKARMLAALRQLQSLRGRSDEVDVLVAKHIALALTGQPPDESIDHLLTLLQRLTL